jgi:hypothetical protein
VLRDIRRGPTAPRREQSPPQPSRDFVQCSDCSLGIPQGMSTKSNCRVRRWSTKLRCSRHLERSGRHPSDPNEPPPARRCREASRLSSDRGIRSVTKRGPLRDMLEAGAFQAPEMAAHDAGRLRDEAARLLTVPTRRGLRPDDCQTMRQGRPEVCRDPNVCRSPTPRSSA